MIERGEVTGDELGPLTARGELSAENCTIVRHETGDLDPARVLGALRSS